MQHINNYKIQKTVDSKIYLISQWDMDKLNYFNNVVYKNQNAGNKKVFNNRGLVESANNIFSLTFTVYYHLFSKHSA